MPLDPFRAQAVLNWVLGGTASWSVAPGRFLQFATGSPNQTGGSDGPFSPRLTVSFAAANSPNMSATNLNALTGTATAVATAQGWNLYDSAVGGTRIAYGTFSAVIGCKSADSPSVAAGLLKITLT